MAADPGSLDAVLRGLGTRVRRDTFVVVLTGAGISAESGIRTFRDGNGLWEEHRVEDVASPEGFVRDPDLVHRFYNARRRQLFEVEPGPAHRALAAFQGVWPGEMLLVTQNVDDLHERAGARILTHMHGELRKARCMKCGTVHRWLEDLGRETPCPHCGRAGGMRPHIVWFGEMPFELDLIGYALDRCGLFLSIGTSGNVYPAAGFVDAIRPEVPSVELNLQAGERSNAFEYGVHGPAGAVVPALLRGILDTQGF